MTEILPVPILRRGNPFRVYPVSRLQGPEDTYAFTVETPGVEFVSKEIKAFCSQFRKDQPDATIAPATSEPLVISIEGPPGSGKTHLLNYAQAKLQKKWPVVALMLRASVTPWEQWFRQTCAQGLRDLNLPNLFTDLLAQQAVVIARAMKATQPIADEITTNPGRVYEFLRQGEISVTDVERRFRAAIDAACPDGTQDLRIVLKSLHRRDVGKDAVRWLCGETLTATELDRLGAQQVMQLPLDAAPTLAALASISLQLGRVYLLCIDELERFTDWPPGTGSQDPHNREWLRRLAEAVAPRGGVLMLAGLSRAWRQPVDVLDRLSTRKIVKLTIWDENTVRELVEKTSGDWAARWKKDTFAEVARMTSGNIRRIQTILFDLYTRTAEEENALVDMETIAVAARRLRQPDYANDILDPIARAAEAAGGRVERDAEPLDVLRLDLLIRKNEIPHLAVRLATASFISELARIGAEFWQGIRRLQREQGLNLRGLLVVYGASDPTLLAELTKYSTLTVIDGGGPDAEDRAINAVKQRMSEPVSRADTNAAAVADHDAKIAGNVFRIAEASEETKLAQRLRLEGVSKQFLGGESELKYVGLDVASALSDREELDRVQILEHFEFLASKPLSLSKFLTSSNVLMTGFGGAMVVFMIILFPAEVRDSTISPQFPSRVFAACLVSLLAIVGMAAVASRQRDLAQLSRRMAANVVREMFLSGADAVQLARVRTPLDAVIFASETNASAFAKIRDSVFKETSYVRDSP